MKDLRKAIGENDKFRPIITRHLTGTRRARLAPITALDTKIDIFDDQFFTEQFRPSA